jgi:hypothetical protein
MGMNFSALKGIDGLAFGIGLLVLGAALGVVSAFIVQRLRRK